MRLSYLIAPLSCLVIAIPIRAQSYGTFDVACPSRLNERVNDYQPVRFGDQEFFTSWISKSRTYPLPSYNWYRAYPDPDPLSLDRRYRWVGAEIQVHCFVERNPYFVRWHYHPVAGVGTLRAVEPGDDGGCGGNEVDHLEYDPYASEPSPSECQGSGAGGGESGGLPIESGTAGGGEVCGGGPVYYDMVCIDVWNPDTGAWEEWWCGIAAFCD